MARRSLIPLSGPLASYGQGFHEELARAGYAERSTAALMTLLAQFSVWLEGRGLRADELTTAVAEEFVRSRNDAGARWRPTVRTLKSFLEYLHDRGVTASSAPICAPTPVELLCDRFRRYLASERGLAEGTIDNYARVAGLFVSQLQQVNGRPDLTGLSVADVTDFVTREVAVRSVGSAKNLITGLRSLLGYLHLQGETVSPLGQALPTAAGWSGNALPRAIAPGQVKQLLASCDRRGATGRRDYAVLLLLVRLGLRAREVAGLQLDDVGWRIGEVVVRGKGNSVERLPLPADVGEALAGYLRHGRPASADRALFLRAHAPRAALTPAGLADIVRTAGQRAGVAGVSAHGLRHTAATEMLRAGGSLPEVALVLRHRSTATTARYAKVDQAALRSVARPWPGGAR